MCENISGVYAFLCLIAYVQIYAPGVTMPSTVKVVCPVCGAKKTGRISCCFRGGSWYNKCGDPGDPNFEYTWAEGNEICNSKFKILKWFAGETTVFCCFSITVICLLQQQPGQPSPRQRVTNAPWCPTPASPVVALAVVLGLTTAGTRRKTKTTRGERGSSPVTM